jgi:phosphodiesterase/alkaline phosphatase D-like protein
MTLSAKHTIALLTFTVLLLLPVMAIAQQAQPLTITHGPKVEYVGRDKAEIAWTTSTGGSSVIHYGTDPNNLNQTAEAPYDKSAGNGQHVTHRVTINGLQPNTTYYFVVDSGQGQGTGTEAKGQVGQFKTKQ